MPRVIYNNKNAVFFKSLKQAVDAYFKDQQIAKTGDWRLYSKALILVPVAIALYLFLLFAHYPAWLGIILSALWGVVLALVGFNIMHDACHGSYSSRKWVNELLSLSLNALGGNAFFWKSKHNIIHHTYTNVDGVDDDIAHSPIIRMCSTQRWYPIHRVQHIYTPLLYSFSSIFWILTKDFINYFSRQIYTTPLPKMDRKEHVIFWVSKLMYVLFYIVLPILAVGFLPWLVGFLVMHFTLGITLSVVFQLAHVVEETEFEFVAEDAEQVKLIESEWAVHQIKTTANFSPNNKFISWCVGGLNYQVEHHLFPRICHIHYPELSRIVREKCVEYNLTYHSIPTMSGAFVSHIRLIKLLGRKPQLALAS